MTVSTIYGSTADGSLRGGANASLSAARSSGTYASADSGTRLLAGYGSYNAGDEYTYTLARGYLVFDTSAIPADATINSVTLQVYVRQVYDNGANLSCCLVASTAASSPPTSGDWGNIGSTELATRIAYLTFGANNSTDNGYKTFTLNSSGKAAINRGGTTKLALVSSMDLDSSAPGSGKYAGCYIDAADATGTSTDPVLTVDWTAAVISKSASDSGTASEGTPTVAQGLSVSASDSAGATDTASAAMGATVVPSAPSVFGLTSDGSVRGGSGSSWAAARAAFGSSSGDQASGTKLLAGYASNNAGDEFTYTIGRGFVNFDTSSLPAGTITDVRLGLYVTNVYNGRSGGGAGPDGSLVVTSGTPASSPPSNSDFSQVGSTEYGRVAYSSMGAHASTPNAYTEIQLNAAGIAAINRSGTTKLALLASQDFDASAPANLTYNGAYIATADATGTSTDPYLIVTYAPITFGLGQESAAATDAASVAMTDAPVSKSATDTATATDTAALTAYLPRGIAAYSNAASAAITKGASGKWDDTIVYLPRWCKNLDGTLYRDSQNRAYLYYTGSGATAGVDRDRVGLMRTTDFSTWERVSTNSPVLGWGPSGTYDASGSTWDGTDVAACTILWDGSQFVMFFEGNSTSNEAGDNIQIGLATSSDGITWTKYASNPILTVGANGTDGGGDVYAPIVMKDGATWKMWFGGHSGSHQPSSYGGNYGVMYATASSPQGPWTKYSTSYVFKPTENIGPEQILKDTDGTYRLVYANYDDLLSVKVATSRDGITFTYEKTLLTVGTGGAWDDGRVYWTDTAIDNGRLVLAYTGANAAATAFGIGVVVSVPVGSETATVTDASSVTVGVGAIAKTASDSVTVTDTASRSAVTRYVTAIDTAVVTDSSGSSTVPTVTTIATPTSLSSTQFSNSTLSSAQAGSSTLVPADAHTVSTTA